MAFRNLSERFLANAATLYAHGSTKDGSTDQPYIEFKPLDPDANETEYDSRFLPIGSTKRDLERIGDFIKSNAGVSFLLGQGVQQTGNIFSETRILNPLFILGNIIPYLHAPRVLTGQNAFPVIGDLTQASPASFDPQINSAGRLQKQSSVDAVSRATGNSGGTTGLLALLNPVNLATSLASTFGFTDVGTLGVNQRPEFDVDGEYFSVRLWEGGYKKTPQDGLTTVAANLRTGNFAGAFDALKGTISSAIFGSTKRIPNNPSIADGRDSTSPDFDGRRYFFEVDGSDERYLQYTIDFDGQNRPVVSMPFMSRTPYAIAITDSAAAVPADSAIDVVDTLRKADPAVPQGGFIRAVTPDPSQIAPPPGTPTDDNPAENSMHFSDLALSQRYANDDRLEFIRTSIANQKQTKFDYWNSLDFTSLGFDQGNKTINVGAENDIDPRTYRGGGANGSYQIDLTNTDITLVAGATGLTDDGYFQYKSAVGSNTVLVIFYDFGNQTAIPFRALITGFNESTRPEYSERRYIGRVERNIVYAGAVRETHFQLHVMAMSEAELTNIWAKINHLTGLCFPAKYSNGYMVPPFVKLTLGGIYRDQPGFFNSLSHNFDDVSWDIDAEVPQQVVIDVGFSIIEQASPSSTFDGFYSINKS